MDEFAVSKEGSDLQDTVVRGSIRGSEIVIEEVILDRGGNIKVGRYQNMGFIGFTPGTNTPLYHVGEMLANQ